MEAFLVFPTSKSEMHSTFVQLLSGVLLKTNWLVFLPFYMSYEVHHVKRDHTAPSVIMEKQQLIKPSLFSLLGLGKLDRI